MAKFQNVSVFSKIVVLVQEMTDMKVLAKSELPFWSYSDYLKLICHFCRVAKEFVLQRRFAGNSKFLGFVYFC